MVLLASDFNKAGGLSRTVVMIMIAFIGVWAAGTAVVTLVESVTGQEAQVGVLVDPGQVDEIISTTGEPVTLVEAEVLVQVEAPLWLRLVDWLGFDALRLVVAWVAFIAVQMVGSWPQLFSAVNVKRIRLLLGAAYVAFLIQIVDAAASVALQERLELDALTAEISFTSLVIVSLLIGLGKAFEKAIALQQDSDLAV